MHHVRTMCQGVRKPWNRSHLYRHARNFQKDIHALRRPSSACISCLSCAKICPTRAIDFAEDEKTRNIWGREFELIRCKECGAAVGTKEEMDYAAMRCGEEPTYLCPDCRKKKMADVMAHAYGAE